MGKLLQINMWQMETVLPVSNNEMSEDVMNVAVNSCKIKYFLF